MLTKDCKVSDAVRVFVRQKISSLPVISSGSGGRIEDILCKYDVLQLAASENSDSLEMSVGEAVDTKQSNIEQVVTCRGRYLSVYYVN